MSLPKKKNNKHLFISSPELIGELIGYSWSGVRPSLSVRSKKFQTSSPKPLAQSKPNYKLEPPRVGGTKVCSRHLCHMTKMAATPIYGKNPSKIFSRTGRPIFGKLGMLGTPAHHSLFK